MNADLEELKALVYGDPEYDQESRDAIAALEEQFEKAVTDQRLLTISSVVDYVKYLEDEIAGIKEKLSEETLTLSERNQIQLYERKKAARIFLDYFKPENRVEKTIKQHLNVVKGKKDIFEAE